MRAKIVILIYFSAIVSPPMAYSQVDLIKSPKRASASRCANRLRAKNDSNAYAAVLQFEDFLNTRDWSYEAAKNHRPIGERDWDYELPELTRIPISAINDKQDITNRSNSGQAFYGQMNAGLVVGSYGGAKVFVKKIYHAWDSNLSLETQFTILLSALELGPRFVGIATERGRPVGVITEYIEGRDLYRSNLKDQKRGSRIYSFLSGIGVQAKDLQFKVDMSGRLWTVDPGSYQAKKRTLRNSTDLESAWEQVIIDTRASGE